MIWFCSIMFCFGNTQQNQNRRYSSDVVLDKVPTKSTESISKMCGQTEKRSRVEHVTWETDNRWVNSWGGEGGKGNGEGWDDWRKQSRRTKCSKEHYRGEFSHKRRWERKRGVVQGGDRDDLGRIIMGVMSVPAASLSIFSHYPPEALTGDFFRGHFKSKKQKSPDMFLLEQRFIFLNTKQQ